MPNPKQPIQLIQAKGKKHLTKAEIEERTLSEPSPITDNIEPPAYLTAKQKRRFKVIADQLIALNVMGETDCDALARYVIAEEMYIKLSKTIARVKLPEDITTFERCSNMQDKYFKQCRAAANDLGLSISARCRLIVPKASEKPPENKFNRFQNTQAG
ncbi:MAG: phage terminase small subunit P27 family [Ruminococcus sp.]|nr:phage terminase small subunit P27 family [Ruminococcus sp.]